MTEPKSSANMSEGTSVSNSSLSPPGRVLLEPITLDFDPMSFQYQEDSPLTSPSGPGILNLTQEGIDFFDPFCPVKEESPTDYYPNISIGEEDLQYSDGFPFATVEEIIPDQLQSCSSTVDIANKDYMEHLETCNMNEDYAISENLLEIDGGNSNEDYAIHDSLLEIDFDNPNEDIASNDEVAQLDIDNSTEDYAISNIIQIETGNPNANYAFSDNRHVENDSPSESFGANDELISEETMNNLVDMSLKSNILNESEPCETKTFCNVLNKSEMSFIIDTDHDPQNINEAKSETIEYKFPLQHDQCQITATSDDHVTRKARNEKRSTKSSSISKEIKNISNNSAEKENERISKDVSKPTTNGYTGLNGIDKAVNLKNTKITENDSKNIQGKNVDGLGSVTDLMSTYVSLTTQENLPLCKEKISTGIDIKSLKTNYAQKQHGSRSISPDRGIINTGINIKILKSSFVNSQQSVIFDEVKPSVDRAKAQRTFGQIPEDELCLCKICGKHVYQMEKMKAEKNIFHKNCFRCKECYKLLTIDSYSSNEGTIYCKPHFRQLFQPKARFGGVDAAPNEIESEEGKQRRNEMIIRENIPAELPPDVIRSDTKPDHVLEKIPVDLSSIKSKFELYREEHHLPSTTDVCTLQRSASVMARLAKYQSAVSGADNENEDFTDSENEEEVGEDSTVIKSSKHKEKVVFSGMSNLKSQWETGSVSTTKEEKIEEKKEELNKLRQRICLGRSESMKAVYEKACQETGKANSRSDPVNFGHEVKATHIKEKFEKGELVSEVEEENLEKFRKEKEEDLSVFTEPGIANDAKKLFKQIDATVKTNPIPCKSPNKSPLHEHSTGLYSPLKNADIVKCSEPAQKEEIPIDTTDLSQRYKFFENYTDSPKERKRFQMTPPREPAKEDTPDKEIDHDPNIIRAVDAVDDIPKTDTTRRMLDKFKSMEKESPLVPSGLKPLKRITPPREYTKVDQSHDSSPEDDTNIIHSSYKADDDVIVEADKAKSLKAKFENWDNELKDNKHEEDENEDEDFLPQVDTTKTLRAKFEAIKEDTKKSVEKPKSKVNRFIQEQTQGCMDMCNICNKKVYPMEKMEASGMYIHKNCFRCAHCSCVLRLENYTKSGMNLYCTPHFKQLFISKGNYDEGFGREQHKDKWNRNSNNTSVSQDVQEGEDVDFYNDEQFFEQTL